MGFLDFITKLLGNNKKNINLITMDLTKNYGENTPLEVAVYADKTPLSNKEVTIRINGVNYARTTNNEGVAKLNINLPVGMYDALITYNGDNEYNKSTAYCKVNINPILITEDMRITYQDNNAFTAILKDINEHSIPNTQVYFLINNVRYVRTTNEKGEAHLPINLNAGSYEIRTIVGSINKKNMIYIDKKSTRMEGTDITMTAGDGSKYQCAVYAGESRVSGEVDINLNGKRYHRKPDENGLYKLNINLPAGTYGVSAEYRGDNNHHASSVNNKIIVNNPPKPEPEPIKRALNPYMTNSGCSGMGQCTGYYCACNSVQQAIYRLTGERISESTLASVGGTTSAGTGHEGINTMIAWFNRKYGYNLKISWKNFSEVGWSKLQEYIDTGAVFFHLLYRNQWGHYEVPKQVSGGNIIVLNSLGSSCGNGTYCGYIEARSKSTQQSYINGISQKSVCIITF